jgi:ectoine hydroxylase-related dioxygenase (phytanoyl-CoA dioxygenase family)
LQYISGSHLGEVRSHYLQNGHVVTADVDPSQAIAAPAAAGEAMVHHCRTLHYAGPNGTDQPRRAVQVICRVTNANTGEIG